LYNSQVTAFTAVLLQKFWRFYKTSEKHQQIGYLYAINRLIMIEKAIVIA